MRGCSLRAFFHPSGFDDNHRLVARRGARRRHELASGGDRFEIKQDRMGLGVARQVVKHIAAIHIGAIA